MKYFKRKKEKSDGDTEKYIRKIKTMQMVIYVLFIAAFVLFGREIVLTSGEYLKVVTSFEVEEAMQETVNNVILHIDAMRVHKKEEVTVYVEELAERMKRVSFSDAAEVKYFLRLSEKNELGLSIEAIYSTENDEIFYIRTNNLGTIQIEETEKEELCKEVEICEKVNIGEQEIILLVKLEVIEELAKAEAYDYIHLEHYEGNQSVWVNEILDMKGGRNYAIRRIYPNAPETEGKYLSTFMRDIKGNALYLTELEGIQKEGKVFQVYYIDNRKENREMEVFSYAQYYEPFNWVVVTGETIEEMYLYAEVLNQQNVINMVMLLSVFILLMLVLGWLFTKIIAKQAQGFRKKLWTQVEMLEDIYTTMSVGLMRFRMNDYESEIVKINPKGLELLCVDNIDELMERYQNNVIEHMDTQDVENFIIQCKQLKKQWDNAVVECRVTWKDGSVHLLKVYNTLVEFDGTTKIIQSMCQDITEERNRQQRELMEIEEKASLDPMTQIKNKKAIEHLICENIKEAEKNNLSIAVGFVDIDNFKDYNTFYGHLQGDEVIKYVAHLLRDNIKGVVGRIGGDEFSFCMLNTSEEEIEEIMQYIHRQLNHGIPLIESIEVVPTPCSIGIVVGKKANLEYSYVIEQADKAMYLAKERGKNTYCILNL